MGEILNNVFFSTTNDILTCATGVATTAETVYKRRSSKFIVDASKYTFL